MAARSSFKRSSSGCARCRSSSVVGERRIGKSSLLYQEDDRTGQYRECAQEILGYAKKRKLNLKVIFVNDGPGLLLGSMWNDYAHLEALWAGKVKVVTLRMVVERITAKWLRA